MRCTTYLYHCYSRAINLTRNPCITKDLCNILGGLHQIILAEVADAMTNDHVGMYTRWGVGARWRGVGAGGLLGALAGGRPGGTAPGWTRVKSGFVFPILMPPSGVCCRVAFWGCCRPVQFDGLSYRKVGMEEASTSTVLELPFVYIQWSQAVTLFPVIKACKLVAL